MTQVNDIELKKAALLIAKLLLRTREGKIRWARDEDPGFPGMILFTAQLEDDLRARLIRNDKQLKFVLAGAPILDADRTDLHEFAFGNQILAVSLDHSHGRGERLNPESIVYRDIKELIELAEHPKSVSDDLKFKQAMTYLDKLAV